MGLWRSNIRLSLWSSLNRLLTWRKSTQTVIVHIGFKGVPKLIWSLFSSILKDVIEDLFYHLGIVSGC